MIFKPLIYTQHSKDFGAFDYFPGQYTPVTKYGPVIIPRSLFQKLHLPKAHIQVKLYMTSFDQSKTFNVMGHRRNHLASEVNKYIKLGVQILNRIRTSK